MDNQKDLKKTDLNINGHLNASGYKTLSNIHIITDNSIYDFANKKTEKLVTALYMVSDCMENDEALKNKIRLLGVELLSDIYKLSTLSPIDKKAYIAISLNHISELLSFIEIACTIGFISEMNTNILKNEFSSLINELKLNKEKDNHFTFTLDEKMFEIPESLKNNKTLEDKDFIKDKNIKRTFNGMSFINKSPLENSIKRTHSHRDILAEKEERTNRIISIIKDISKGQTNKDGFGVSIKDISLSLTDCSEKTIQRELNNLVLNGKLLKVGAKRWSRYAVVESSK